MSDDEQDDMPDFDWSQVEYAANNNGSTEGSDEPSIQTMIISPDMLARRLLWDTVPCDLAVPVSKYLQLPTASDEVEEMEHQESHARLNKAAILAPIVDMMASAAAKSIVGAMAVANKDNEATPYDGELFNEALERLQPLAYQSTIAIIGELMDLGMLQVPMIVGPQDLKRMLEEEEGKTDE